MGLLESLKKKGIVDFHMRAVPGTEVPDHKVWWGRCIREINQQKASSLCPNSCQIYALCKETSLLRVIVQAVESTLRRYLGCRQERAPAILCMSANEHGHTVHSALFLTDTGNMLVSPFKACKGNYFHALLVVGLGFSTGSGSAHAYKSKNKVT